MIHKPEPKLQIITPIPENAPFTKESLEQAAEIFGNTNLTIGQKLLAINFDLNQILFTWAFEGTFTSSFILVFTCKGQFYNDEIDQSIIQQLIEESYDDPEINGDGDVDYTFNGITLVITIKHQYSI